MIGRSAVECLSLTMKQLLILLGVFLLFKCNFTALVNRNGGLLSDLRDNKVFSVVHEIRTREKRDGKHVELRIPLDDQPRVVDLILNHRLLARDVFLKAEHGNQTHDVYRSNDEELCQYQGSVRGIVGSSAAVSLCDGVRGAIFTPNATYFLEPSATVGETLVLNSNHLMGSLNHSCGFPDTPHRWKRDTGAIRGPYNENADSRYVELVLVVDQQVFKDKGEDLQKVYSYCKDIANIINSLFVPLNIYIALVGVVAWTDTNQINITSNGETTLNNFLRYRRERLINEHPNDNAQLITKTTFEGGVLGKALKGPICTYEFSGGVSTDFNSIAGVTAQTVAHALGHNFGMEHDTPDCQCPDENCIMSARYSILTPKHWSSCSKESLQQAFKQGMDYCLRNKPTHLHITPVCGNGFVETGEQCDCGLPENCQNACCDPETCLLSKKATCATGRCCDLTTCQLAKSDQQCRESIGECDLPDFCSGLDENCPEDVYKNNGAGCLNGTAFCYKGKCPTATDQCKLLWGASGENADDVCYSLNTAGSRKGNCGYSPTNQTYVKCNESDVKCGRLFCNHNNTRLEFGMAPTSILSNLYVQKKGQIIGCRAAIIDLGLNDIDPGLVPDGTKCGEKKMCVQQKCRSVDAVRSSTFN